jgi:GNAT superfamily N-acetyltransferase
MICRALALRDHPDAYHLYQALPAGGTLAPMAASKAAFETLIAHPGTTVFGAEVGNRIVSMATLHLLPNVTYDARPYAVVENVVTLPDHARQGYGRAVMTTLAKAAWAQNAYKIMLLTGRQNAAEGFYRSLGYDDREKHGMILRAP